MRQRFDRAVSLVVLLQLCGVVGPALCDLPSAWRELAAPSVEPTWHKLLRNVDPLVSNAWFQRFEGELVIMAVGTATVAGGGSQAQAENNAMEGAKALAQAEMVKLIYGVDVKSECEVREGTSVKTTAVETVIDDFFETRARIQTVAKGVSRGSRVAGRWFSKDRRTAGVLMIADKRTISDAGTWAAPPPTSPDTIILEGHGYARQDPDRSGVWVVRVEGMGISADVARDNALREAVSVVFGVVVSSATLVQNTETVTNRLRAMSTGYIQDFVVLDGPRCETNHCTVTLKAWVSGEALAADVRRLSERMGNPVLVVLTEGESDSYRETGEAVKAELLSTGFTVHDFDPVMSGLGSSREHSRVVQALRDRYPSVDMAIILSSDISVQGGRDIYVARGSFRLKALDARTGQLLGSVSAMERGRSLSSAELSRAAAAQEGARALVRDFSKQIVANWERKVADGFQYLVRARGIDPGDRGHRQVEALKQALELCPGKRSVAERRVGSGTVEIDLIHEGLLGEVRSCLMERAQTDPLLRGAKLESMGGTLIEVAIQ